ncbi:protein NATD1-like [Diachasma alloeum]|uniref:protein NATD1-like n=1 Tax=Diachasma alloeum TaxID=454923 RepID=UPI0007383D2B|nr:protein NATD1-like [Diachasma alloeum]
MFGAVPSILKHFTLNIIHIRSVYGVFHNPNRRIFYVKLNNNDRAVLLYKKDNNTLDMRSINVPTEYQGRGLARILAEAALTYAIVHDYRIILTCKYMQNFYLATKNRELEERVIGPSNLLSPSAKSLHPDTIDDLPDPQDPVNSPNK